MKSLLNILENREMIKAIMISDKPRYCALMMNGDKTIEVRKNKALATAIQKLINKNGYADIYGYCSKDTKNLLHKNCADIYWVEDKDFRNKNKQLGLQTQSILNGKVLFKFRCYKVEEIELNKNHFINEQYSTDELDYEELLEQSCLSAKEIDDYLQCEIGYAIHISNLEIFDRPRELGEFHTVNKYGIPQYQFGKGT